MQRATGGRVSEWVAECGSDHGCIRKKGEEDRRGVLDVGVTLLVRGGKEM